MSYDRLGNPLPNYDRLGNPLTTYDRLGNVIGGGGDPIPVDPPVPPFEYGPYAEVLENANHLAGYWDVLKAADTTNAPLRVLWTTNSLYGYHSTGTTTVNLPEFNKTGHVNLTRAALRTRFGTGGEGIVPFTDGRWTTSGGPSSSANYGLGMRGYLLTTGKSVTFTPFDDTDGARPDEQFDHVRFMHTVGSLPDTALPTYYIDGVSMGTATPGTVVGETVIDTHTVALGKHTVLIDGPATGTAYVSPPEFSIGDTESGALVTRGSAPGGYAYNVLAPASSVSDPLRLRFGIDIPDPDIYIPAFGHNEWRSGQGLTSGGTPAPITPTQFYDITMFGLEQQIAVREKWAVLPIGPGASEPSVSYFPEEAFWDVYREIAQTDKVACYDYAPVLGPFPGVGVGTWTDGIHQDGEGHQLMSLVDLGCVFPEGAALDERISDAAA